MDAQRDLEAAEHKVAALHRLGWEEGALVIVVGIDQVLKFERRVCSLTGDAALARARRDFDVMGPRAVPLRDLVAHLDQYATRAGQRQTGERLPAINDPYLSTFLHWEVNDAGEESGTILTLADESMNLRAAANAAVKLAAVVEEVRAKYVARAGEDLQRAFERRWGHAH